MNTVILDHVFSSAIMNPQNLVTRVQAIDPFEGLLSLLGFTVASDLTMVLGGLLHRTIRLQTNALGDSIYGGDANKIKDATRNLFVGTFGLRTPSFVTAAVPVVS